jgi:hypothetical protein
MLAITTAAIHAITKLRIPILLFRIIARNKISVAKLFEVGPASYTPGTKMPGQRIGASEERDAPVKFLERATR